MKKIIKLTLKIIGGFILVILLAAVLIPIIFKEDIQKAIDSEISKNVNATVFYDTDAFSVSLFRSFPDLSVAMGNFGIKGIDVFEEDTLVAVKNFELTIDIMSIMDDIKIEKIQLDEPELVILVLEDGTANYDIAVPSEEVAVEEEVIEESAPINISINKWEINNADVVYYDESMDFYTVLEDLTHTGSGNFASEVFEMATRTTIGSFSLGYGGTDYIANKSIAADITMKMDLANMSFGFAENRVSVNDFAMGFDGTIAMPGDDITMDITFAGKEIDMKSILSLIPGAYTEYLDGIEASGEINFDGSVKGVFNDTSMPKVKTNLSINNGKVNTPDLPQPLEKIEVAFGLDYPSADLAETSITLEYSSELAEQKTALKLDFQNLVDYQWDVDFTGEMDLEKISKFLPLENTTLRGAITANLKTAGRMSDVDAEDWAKLPTSGQINVDDFFYQSPDLPQGFGMSKVDAGFDPDKIELRRFSANAGKTDLALSGIITNYIAFALEADEVLVGKLDFKSSKVDLNEWMTTEEVVEEEEVVEDTFALEIVRIPTNIDFTLTSKINALIYDNLTLEDFKGNLLVKNGSIIIDGAGFNLLNGTFTLDGEYASAPEQPSFDFDFGIKELSIPESFKAFTPIQKLVPAANKMTGNFSTNFAAKGLLGSDMMPVMNSISGSGMVEIAEATIKNIKALNDIQKIANLKGGGGKSEQLAKIKDVALSMKIQDGRLSIKPFSVTIAGNKAVVSGSSGLDGTIDYAMALKVPTGQAGKAVNQALAKFTGGKDLVSDFLDLDIGIGGTFDDPKVKLLGAKPGGGAGSLANNLKKKVKEKAEKKIAEAKEKVDKKVTEVKQKAEEKKEEVKKEVTEKVDKEKAKVEEKVEEKKVETKKKAEKKGKKKVNSLLNKKKKKKKKSGN